MSLFKPHKVTALPTGSAIDPNGIYFLKVSGGFQIHIPDGSGGFTPLGFLPLSGGVLQNPTGFSTSLIIANSSSATDSTVALLQLGRDTATGYQAEASLITRPESATLRRVHPSGAGFHTDILLTEQFITVNKPVKSSVPITQILDSDDLVTKAYVDANSGGGTPTPAATPSYVMARSSAPTTQNIYSTSWQELPMVGAGFDVANPDYEIAGNGIKCLFDGWIEVCAQMHITSVGQRSALQMRLRNGAYESLQIASTGYIRVTSGHNESSLRAVDHIQVSNGDIITAESQRESTNATAVYLKNVGGASMIIKRL